MVLMLVRGRGRLVGGICRLIRVGMSGVRHHSAVVVMVYHTGLHDRMVRGRVPGHHARRRRRDGDGDRENGEQQCAHECQG